MLLIVVILVIHQCSLLVSHESRLASTRLACHQAIMHHADACGTESNVLCLGTGREDHAGDRVHGEWGSVSRSAA